MVGSWVQLCGYRQRYTTAAGTRASCAALFAKKRLGYESHLNAVGANPPAPISYPAHPHTIMLRAGYGDRPGEVGVTRGQFQLVKMMNLLGTNCHQMRTICSPNQLRWFCTTDLEICSYGLNYREQLGWHHCNGLRLSRNGNHDMLRRTS